MKHKVFTARTELKSLTRSIKCAETECGGIRLLSECLGDSSMRLGVPFIAPRQLGAVGSQQGRPKFPSVGWCPDSPVHHQTVPVACSVRISFLIWRRRPLHLGVGWRTGHCLVHTGQSGVPFRPLVRATCRPPISLPTVAQSTVGSPDNPVHYRTVRCTTGQSGEFLSYDVELFPRATTSPRTTHRTVRCTTGQSGEL
jgi:hypothetical protein